jgi:hypothetical protein
MILCKTRLNTGQDRKEMASSPEEFLCPITLQLMIDPVIGSDGRSYERAAINQWLRSNPCSPMTRQPMTASSLKPNYALKSAIDRFRAVPVPRIPAAPSAPPAEDVYYAMNVYQQDVNAQQQALLRYGPQTAVQPVVSAPVVMTQDQVRNRRKLLGACVCLVFGIFLIVIISRIYMSA